jgi:hypothetical protein
MLMGSSGSGKTYSLKQFKAKDVSVISVEKARLPFKTDIKPARIPENFSNEEITSYAQVNAARYSWLQMAIKSAPTKAVVIDDSQYMLSTELFDRAKEKGYDKFTDIAANFRNLIHFINNLPEEDKIVYFLHHTELDTNGTTKVKTIGKMLDEKLVIEGCFDIVILCENHKFLTQSNGTSTAKTPEDMFEDLEIPNDLKFVDSKIREYYGFSVGGGKK